MLPNGILNSSRPLDERPPQTLPDLSMKPPEKIAPPLTVDLPDGSKALMQPDGTYRTDKYGYLYVPGKGVQATDGEWCATEREAAVRSVEMDAFQEAFDRS